MDLAAGVEADLGLKVEIRGLLGALEDDGASSSVSSSLSSSSSSSSSSSFTFFIGDLSLRFGDSFLALTDRLEEALEE